MPGAGYPFAWALLGWLDGHDLCAVVLDGPVPGTWAAGADDVLTALAGRHRVGVLRRALDLGREAAPFAGPPVLLHADLIPGNLLHREGRLTGLLDLGALTTGDPAWDLTPAWWVLDAPGRSRLRDLLGGDDAVWARARALATVQGALATWHNTPRRHPLAALGDRALQQVVADLSRA
ncbi:phosphotransferase [Janibacter melonis]|uniref:phosphotransferase n=1 Tax=Janibacter melonis TaxID=262209 RepID=UPI002043B248|nr:phosphotransferase [Janibacter melonis]MCM3555434.1 phosphotransferase [Janibacter melonis]